MYTREELQICIDFARTHDLHLISDEIYALTIMPGCEMLSIAQLESDYPKIHICGGLSKDFGISGFRIGILYSKNQNLLNGIAGIGYFEGVSNHTQWVLTKVLSDEVWLDNYITTNQQRVYQRFLELKDALSVINVILYESKGTLMAWADFRACLPDNPTWKDEEKLCIELFEKCGLLITPGQTCIADKPGFFRLVYTESADGAIQELKLRL
jgi:1-aminocyclopropane-1-carboxylate synthase